MLYLPVLPSSSLTHVLRIAVVAEVTSAIGHRRGQTSGHACHVRNFWTTSFHVLVNFQKHPVFVTIHPATCQTIFRTTPTVRIFLSCKLLVSRTLSPTYVSVCIQAPNPWSMSEDDDGTAPAAPAATAAAAVAAAPAIPDALAANALAAAVAEALFAAALFHPFPIVAQAASASDFGAPPAAPPAAAPPAAPAAPAAPPAASLDWPYALDCLYEVCRHCSEQRGPKMYKSFQAAADVFDRVLCLLTGDRRSDV